MQSIDNAMTCGKGSRQPTRRQGVVVCLTSLMVLLVGVAAEVLFLKLPQLVEMPPAAENAWLYGFVPLLGLGFIYYFVAFLRLGLREVKQSRRNPEPVTS